jgi:phage baseplate assembly protein W
MKSISIPFRFSNGRVADTEDNGIIAKQRIIDCLATDRYERVARPEYGANIKSLLFDNFDPLVFADYRIDAIAALDSNVRNAKIVDLQIRNKDTFSYGSSDESTISVRVVYRTSDGGTATFVANLDPNKILTEESTI